MLNTRIRKPRSLSKKNGHLIAHRFTVPKSFAREAPSLEDDQVDDIIAGFVNYTKETCALEGDETALVTVTVI